MILSKIYKNLSNDNKESLAWGLVGGLIWGLVGGLVSGLAWGLVGGLVGGLAWGLVGGLVGGLIWGLVVILIHFTEALPFINGTLPVLGIILVLIILIEILFWLSPKEKVKKKDLIKYTLLKKGEATLEVLMIFSAITQIYVFTREIDFVKYLPEILKWIGYIGAVFIALGIIIFIGYLFVKLNSLKYKR